MKSAFQKSAEFFKRALRVSPGGVHSPVRAFKGVGGTPLFMERASGSHIWDVDGNRYLDYCMSWGPLIFGHAHEEISAAVEKIMRKGWTFGTAETLSLELAELITQHIPFIDQIRFVSSGTEAVLSALRLARAATGKNKIIKFEGCYHGHIDSLLVKAGSGLADMGSPDSAGVSAAQAAETLVCPLDDLSSLEALFSQHSGEIAALIIEPLPANNGLLPQKAEFLQALRRLCDENQALLIFDEVISGFRLALGGYSSLCAVKPDIVTYGKVIGGGFPVGAYAAKREIMQLIAPVGTVYQAGTLSANPVAMAAGLANLKKLIAESPYEKLASDTAALAKGIERACGGAIKVQLEGSLFWMISGEVQSQDKCVRRLSQIPSAHKEIYPKVFHRMVNQGVYLAPSAFEVSFVSTAHTEEDHQFLIESMQKAVLEQ